MADLGIENGKLGSRDIFFHDYCTVKFDIRDMKVVYLVTNP